MKIGEDKLKIHTSQDGGRQKLMHDKRPAVTVRITEKQAAYLEQEKQNGISYSYRVRQALEDWMKVQKVDEGYLVEEKENEKI